MKMKKNYLKHLLLGMGIVGTIAGHAQTVTLKTVLAADPVSGSTSASVLSIAKNIGGGTSYYRPAGLQGLCFDKSGNLTFLSFSQNRVGVTRGDKVILLGVQGVAQSVSFDKNDDFLYVASYGGAATISGATINAGDTIITLSTKPNTSRLYIGAPVTGSSVTTTAGTPNTFVTAISTDSLRITISRPATTTNGAVNLSFSGINRYIYNNNGLSTSFGFYADSAVGTSTTRIIPIPFIRSGDLVFLDGSATTKPLYFANIITGTAINDKGDFYFADRDNHVVRKISMLSSIVTANSKSDTLVLSAPNPSIVPGQLVSGMYIPNTTYVKSVDGNIVVLTNKTTAAIVAANGNVGFITGVTTVAGVFGQSGSSGDGNAANAALLNQPRGIAFDSKGNLFICDFNNGRIRKVTAASGDITGSSIISAAISATLSRTIHGLAIDGDDNIYIVDAATAAKKIFRYSNAGVLTNLVGNGTLSIANVSTTAASTTITATTAASFARVTPGMYIRGTNIPAGTTVVSVTDSLNIVLSAAATATATTTVTLASPDETYAATGAYIDNPNSIAYNPIDGKMYIIENGMNIIRSLNSSVITPVELTSFTANKTINSVVLKWTTAQEANNAGFAVEYSTDGTSWNAIGNIVGKGIPSAYTYEHANPSTVNYYRLKQIDNNGAVVYSKILSVRFDNARIIKVYPNPTTNVISLNLGQQNNVKFQIRNTVGALVKAGVINGNQSINVAGLISGNYTIKLSTGENIKFIKK